MSATARAMPDTATYLYCLVHAARRPVLGRVAGLPGGGAPRALEAGNGLWLVVADAPLAQYGSEPIERGLHDLDWVGACAAGHEAVVEAAARHGTIIPMKLFTLFTGDERAVAHVRGTRAALDPVLARVRRRQEWGLRVTLDEAAAPPRAAAGGRGAPTSGTGFLRQRQAAHRAVRERVERARDESERVFETLARHAADTRRATPVAGGGSRVLLDAAFLVDRARAVAFRGAVRRLAAALRRQGVTLALSGPWPPYNFVGDRR